MRRESGIQYPTHEEVRKWVALNVVPFDNDWGESKEDYREDQITIEGNAVVISDVHIPRHCPKTLTRAMKIGKIHGLKRLVIAGDLIDFNMISRHPSEGGPQLSPAEAIVLALRVLKKLSAWFGEIVILKGNHDERLQKLVMRVADKRSKDVEERILADLAEDDVEREKHRIRYVLILRSMLEKEVPELKYKVRFLPAPMCYLRGPRPDLPPWRVTHPRSYSRHAPTVEKKLALKFDQPVLGTHGHIFGTSITPNGKYPVCQFGCSTKPESHLYLFENETDHPKWVNGVAVIQEGRLTTYTDNPYLTDWTVIDEVPIP
jgi:predicted phosphodiesterase